MARSICQYGISPRENGVSGLDEITPPLSAAVLDMLKLQYKVESQTVKWCHYRHCQSIFLHYFGSRV